MGKKYCNLFKFITIIIMISSILMGCQTNTQDNIEKAIAVEVMEVKKMSISKNVTLNAYLEPKEIAVILPKTPGLNVTNIGVNIGDEISKGDFLFELDKTMVRKQIDQSKNAYDLARKNYEEQKKQLDESKDQDSLEALAAAYQNKAIGSLNIPAISQQDKESILAVSISQMEQARMAYSTALSQLKEMEYYSPISGYVSQININENQPILSTQPALVITNVDKLKASFHVSKSLYEYLKEGQPVKVNIASMQVEGKIKALNPIPDRVNNLYLVEVEINSEESMPLVGAFSNVLIELDRKEDVIVIPKSAVLEDNDGRYVFVENDKRVYRRNIEIGIDDSGKVEIISGLNEDEKIVTKGQQFVKDKGLVITVRGVENENL